MRKFIIGTGMLAVSLFSFGQTQNCVGAKNIVGDWFVESIELRTNGSEPNEQVTMMEDALNESLSTFPEPIQYIFKSDGKLILTEPITEEEAYSVEDLETEEESIEYGETILGWKLTSNCNELEIHDEESFDSLIIDDFTSTTLVVLADVNEMYEMFFILRRK